LQQAGVAHVGVSAVDGLTEAGAVLAAVKDAARRFAMAIRPSLTASARGASR
jgi:hypothetical protein